MIDPHWQLTDLDPLTWRNLGRFIEPAQYIRAGQPGERGLYVLHDGTRVLNVVDENNTGFDSTLIRDVSDPRGLAGELHAEGRWDRVHVIHKQHLAAVARQAQRIENRALTLDQYYRHVAQLVWGTQDAAGYACAPPKAQTWNGWTYDGIAAQVARLPARASLGLGIYDGDALHIGVIGEFTEARVTRVTTFEALSLPAGLPQPSAAGLQAIWGAMARACHAPAALLVCTLTVFERWLTAGSQEDKTAVLQSAAADGHAFWRTLATE
jgi:hypothetical protein